MKSNVENRVRAPRGFHFKIVEYKNKKYPGSDHTRVSLRNSKDPEREIGHVMLYKQKRRRQIYWETHSSLNQEYHGKGLGSTMYAKAIQWCLDNGYKVRSSGASSDMAKRVWNGQKIRQFFSIRKRTTSWGQQTWFAFR